MKRIGQTLRFAIATTLVALLPAVIAHAQPAAETAKPERGHETESMMNGQPNADATLRNKSGTPGAPVEGADPDMVKNPPKSDKDMVAKPPASADKGIQVPGTNPEKAPTVAR
jgi:hypothetical protein